MKNDEVQTPQLESLDQPTEQSVEDLVAWSALSASERREKFSNLTRIDAEELFLSFNAHDQAELLTESPAMEKRSWVRLLAPDDVADLIQEMGLEHREEILNLLDPQTRREVIALLAYEEDRAGGLMSSRFVRLRPDMTVDEAISYLRIQAKTQVETIYYAYVMNADQKLLGVVSFRELFATNTGKQVHEIMKTDLVKIPVDLDQEHIGQIFSKHDWMALPVIDEQGIMKGIVTFDDIATAIQEEATEDMQKLGGVQSLEAPYMKTSMLEMIRKRSTWLSILFIGEMLTATAMSYFHSELERAIVLSMFIPLIISSGGNSGSQASTLIIRAMALGEVRLRDWWRVLFREIAAGSMLGLILGGIGLARILFTPGREGLYGPHYFLIAVTVSTSVLGVVLWGAITGSMLPFILKKFNLDPATASAPFVATLVDVTGLVIYFSAANLILSGAIL